MMLPKIMLLAMLTAVLALPATAQEWTTPIIEGYGKIKYYKNTDLQPQKDMQYKVAFDLKSDKKKEGVNAGLWKMARLLNLLGAAGVPAENISLVGVVHGPATFMILKDELYHEKMGESNPNVELLRKLTDYGVIFYVCNQAAAGRDIDPIQDMNEYIKESLSALIDFPLLQQKGYTIMP